MILLLILSAQASELKYKDIKPVLSKHCTQCHNETWADKNWKDEKVTKANAELIKRRVVIDKTMPPGNFTGMTEDERKLIRDWVDGGSK